ncbi:hypothetical protein [Dasania marina]|uniref:hypothetical protein n=1 Tax=Dasania marina TaxID=471499 RepID=UPI00037E1882|nr:hypothetical protein [Dasania marina]
MKSSDSKNTKANKQAQHNAEPANNIATDFDCLKLNKQPPTSDKPKDRNRNDEGDSFLKGYN